MLATHLEFSSSVPPFLSSSVVEFFNRQLVGKLRGNAKEYGDGCIDGDKLSTSSDKLSLRVVDNLGVRTGCSRWWLVTSSAAACGGKSEEPWDSDDDTEILPAVEEEERKLVGAGVLTTKWELSGLARPARMCDGVAVASQLVEACPTLLVCTTPAWSGLKGILRETGGWWFCQDE